MRAAILAVLVLVSAGCLTVSVPDVTNDPVGTALALIPEQPIVQLHDHTDASLHTGSANMELVAFNPLIPEEIGEEGFAALRIVDDFAYIATDGAHAGFLIVDISDARTPTLVGQYVTEGGASQEAVPTPDGNWVFMNRQRTVAPTTLLEKPDRGTGYGIDIVDVSDKTAPRFENFVPVEVAGTHVMFYHEMGGKRYLFYNGQPTRQGLPTGDVYTTPAGNVVKIAEFTRVAGRMTLVPVGEFRYDGSLTARSSQGCFPHDMWVEKNPLTDQEVMYVAHWDCGAVTVDVTNPAAPVYLGGFDDPAPSALNRIHYFRPEPALRDGRLYAFSGPEIAQSPGEPGYIRAYDVTDPRAVSQVGTWRLPGDVENDKPYIFTPHNFDYRGNLLAVAHYHAGVWLLDISDPTAPVAVAYYLPHGEEDTPWSRDVWRKTPNFPEAYLPNVYEAKWFDDPASGDTLLLVTERGTGLYVFQLPAALSPLLTR